MSKPYLAAIAVAVALAVGGTAVTTTVVAQEKEGVSKGAAKALKAVQDAANAKKWDEALTKAQEAKALPTLTPYDKYVIAQFETQAYAAKQNYAKAAEAIEAAARNGQGLAGRPGQESEDPHHGLLPGEELSEGRRDGPEDHQGGLGRCRRPTRWWRSRTTCRASTRTP